MKIVAVNKHVSHDYQILESFEAGMALQGSEVKAIREGRISLKESYAELRTNEVYLVKCHISPYEAANIFNHDPLRDRKLLLHRREIRRLTGKIQERGLTLVPMRVLINDRGKIKLELALAKGKREYEKRDAKRAAEARRDAREEVLGELGVQVRNFYQLGVELKNIFNFGFCNAYSEKRQLRRAYPYLQTTTGGHALDTVANARRCAEAGFDGLVHLCPVGCMPEVSVKPILRQVCHDTRLPLLELVLHCRRDHRAQRDDAFGSYG